MAEPQPRAALHDLGRRVADRDAAGDRAARPDPAAGQRLRTGLRHVTDNTVLLAMATPVLLLVVIYLIYAVDRLPPAQGRRAGRPGGARQRAPADGVDRHHLGARAVAGGLRHGAPGAKTARARAADRRRWSCRSGKKLQVQVIAQQWAFTYRFPEYGGVEMPHLELPVEPDGRTARHLARRDPLLLGLPARRQGGRQPERRQRRVRQADARTDLRSALRRAVRDLARRDVRPRPRRQPRGVRHVDRRTADASSRRRRRRCRRTARPTSPNRRGAPNEHDDRVAAPSPHPSRARCGGGWSASTCSAP